MVELGDGSWKGKDNWQWMFVQDQELRQKMSAVYSGSRLCVKKH
jgi:hypothetical protein